MRATPPSRADVGGNPLQRHHRAGAGLLGDPRLLGRDHVHDHAALEHLGKAGLDPESRSLGHAAAILRAARRATSACRRGCGLCAWLRRGRRGRGPAPGPAPSAPCWSGRRRGCSRRSRGSARRARPTSDIEASEIARVRARRCRASFIARSSSGWARPRGEDDDERLVVDPAESLQRLAAGAGDDLGADVEQAEGVAQVAGEEGHLVDADDHHALGFGKRGDGAVDLLAGQLARGFLEVGVVGAERALQLGVVEGEEGAGAGRAAAGGDRRCGTPRSPPAEARDSPRSRGPGRSAPPSMTRCSLSWPAPRR